MAAPDDLINTARTCRACGGKVANPESRKGGSLAKLAEIHADTCPGIRRGARLEKE